jgi:hypothetical protein
VYDPANATKEKWRPVYERKLDRTVKAPIAKENFEEGRDQDKEGNDMSNRIERCSQCNEPTERAGRADDSIYLATGTPAEIGPLCITCFNTILEFARMSLAAEQQAKGSDHD